MKKIFASLLFLATTLFAMANSEDVAQIGIFEKLDETIPKGLVFTNDAGEEVILDEIIDKPTVLVLVYFNCPGICSPLLDGVTEVVDRSDMVLGIDYQVLTISFNWNETWDLGRDKRKNYFAQLEREIDPNGWRFMTGDSANVQALVDAVGFGFKKEGEDYVHAAALTMLSPKGKITRYLYGMFFNPFDLKMATIEAAAGKSGPTINKVLNYCFSYDAEGKAYAFNITKVAATVILTFAFGLFLYLIIISRKRSLKTA